MDSYGLSETLNQQEGLTNQAQSSNEYLQGQINEQLTTFTNKQNRKEDKDEAAEGEVIGGFGGEVMDAGAKTKGLADALENGYSGTMDQLGKNYKAISSGASKIYSGVSRGGTAIAEAGSSVASGARRVGLLGEQAQSQQRFTDYAERTRQAAADAAEETQPAAAGAGEGAAGAGTGAAATGDAAGAGDAVADAAAGAGDAAGELTGAAATIAEGVGRVAGGAMGAGQLGLDIYKQVEGGSFFKGGVNTGDDIGTITNEIGSVIDIAGAATGDPFLMAAGVGVGLIGSGISGISELFHHEESKDDKPKPPPTSADESPIAVQSLAAEGEVGQAASGSSLAQVQVGGS